MAPVSIYSKLNLFATILATVLLPAPAGPSIAIEQFSLIICPPKKRITTHWWFAFSSVSGPRLLTSSEINFKSRLVRMYCSRKNHADNLIYFRWFPSSIFLLIHHKQKWIHIYSNSPRIILHSHKLSYTII